MMKDAQNTKLQLTLNVLLKTGKVLVNYKVHIPTTNQNPTSFKQPSSTHVQRVQYT